ncbi:MAG: hypothetical protein DRP47_06635 [Candidatus Zixiibacteriota bacterium]|nr:MAG: hypothetical protein DRP47_06635 [candidate division Zixibacteria bacterium]
MNLDVDNLIVRFADPLDGNEIAQLFCEDGTNLYDWSEQKWRHYYIDYPDGQPVALVAEIGGGIIGHYGMLPVDIGGWSAMLGLHAYVSTKYRGLTIISALMAEVDRVCKAKGISLICGFANPQFSLIKKTFFKWNIGFWIGFKKSTTFADVVRDDETFYFHYSDAWYQWRFGEDRNSYLSLFVDIEGNERQQLLKMRNSGANFDEDLFAATECWSNASMYAKDQDDQFCQPFSVKVYDRALVDLGILKPENWFIEMGDSDTFSYVPWSKR